MLSVVKAYQKSEEGIEVTGNIGTETKGALRTSFGSLQPQALAYLESDEKSQGHNVDVAEIDFASDRKSTPAQAIETAENIER